MPYSSEFCHVYYFAITNVGNVGKMEVACDEILKRRRVPWVAEGEASVPGSARWAPRVTPSGRGGRLALDRQPNPTIPVFPLNSKCFQTECLAVLQLHGFVPILGEAHHFLARVARIWHLYSRQRDAFAPERPVNNRSV